MFSALLATERASSSSSSYGILFSGITNLPCLPQIFSSPEWLPSSIQNNNNYYYYYSSSSSIVE